MFKIATSEKISFYSHLCGFFFAIIGAGILIHSNSQNLTSLFLSVTYGGSLIFLFAASSLYHAFKKQENENSFWRKLDHLAIFFLIAGTYTPISYIYLDETWGPAIIIMQWSIVVLGVVLKLFFLHIPRAVYTAIYLFMGWSCLIPINQLINNMSALDFILLFIGGVLFSIGAVIYALKRPVFKPGFFGFHEIFHFYVLLGAMYHYLLVYRAFGL